MDDLFSDPPAGKSSYTAKDIEVLEGLEPVRRRPAMYIGGTDEGGLHHLFAEVLDNAMDEAIAGHATRIEVELSVDGSITVKDNGRGIPTDPHPKNKKLSALEVILTTLHAGGKFSGKVYATSGGLHGVGVSVVNALSDELTVEVARDKKLWRQTYSRGKPTSKLKQVGAAPNRRGTTVTFHPDPEVFGKTTTFRPNRLFRMSRSKAYLHRGVEIRWNCAAKLIADKDETPTEAVFHFPGGLGDFLSAIVGERKTATPKPFLGQASLGDKVGRVEWAVAWPLDGEGFGSTYCNTVPTPEGGTHENGFRNALTRALRAYGELVGNKRADKVNADDVTGEAVVLLSAFIREPQFQGQTKEKLVNPEVTRLIEQAVRDHVDHYLTGDPDGANALLEFALERLDERQRRKAEKDVKRKQPTRKLRLPGKLADCSRSGRDGTELFLVEGDSAGGSAKQARNRETQAILPLRGKILNVASASADKKRANQEIQDLLQALGCAAGDRYREDDLRYERVIIMTDADVDGAHIASLLMTFFYREVPGLIDDGHLFLAVPPLYRLARGGDVAYARDDAHREELMKTQFKGNAKVEVSRFKGLGEMPMRQLKDTTMDPATRILLKVEIAEGAEKSTARLLESLMGRKPELRLKFIQDNATRSVDLDV
jgi:topoisomerase-4 subunit B